jgi:hypothetical protein
VHRAAQAEPPETSRVYLNPALADAEAHAATTVGDAERSADRLLKLPRTSASG